MWIELLPRASVRSQNGARVGPGPLPLQNYLTELSLCSSWQGSSIEGLFAPTNFKVPRL